MRPKISRPTIGLGLSFACLALLLACIVRGQAGAALFLSFMLGALAFATLLDLLRSEEE